jgi:hypothetical protein
MAEKMLTRSSDLDAEAYPEWMNACHADALTREERHIKQNDKA